jgi:hypothetical protein
MPQQQPDRMSDPALGRCVVCGQPVTRDDPGRIRFVSATGEMTNVHARCEQGDAPPSDEA